MQSQAFNIVLPEELVKAVDKQAKKEFKNRSELIRSLLTDYVQKQAKWEELFAYGKKAMKKMGIKSEEEVNRIVEEYRHGRKTR